MREVEGKFRVECSNLESLKSIIESLGLEFKGEYLEIDKYYKHPCRDFLSTDEALRLRIIGDKVLLTYKGPRRDSRFKERIELSVTVPQDVEDILHNLGFQESLVVVKKRRYYEGLNVVITIDIVENLGCFIEIESKRGEVGDVESLVKILGLTMDQYVSETYVEMLLKNINP
ncbi:MAG: class IV adenylate cyclase [Acidilobaceae archaeon]